MKCNGPIEGDGAAHVPEKPETKPAEMTEAKPAEVSLQRNRSRRNCQNQIHLHGGFTSNMGPLETKPRAYRRVTPTERQAALFLQGVAIPVKSKAAPRSKSPHETKPKSPNDSKPKAPKDSRQPTPTPSSKSRGKKLNQTPEQISNQGDNEGADDDGGPIVETTQVMITAPR